MKCDVTGAEANFGCPGSLRRTEPGDPGCSSRTGKPNEIDTCWYLSMCRVVVGFEVCLSYIWYMSIYWYVLICINCISTCSSTLNCMTVQWYSTSILRGLFCPTSRSIPFRLEFPDRIWITSQSVKSCLIQGCQPVNLQISCDLMSIFCFQGVNLLLLVDYASSILGLWFSSSFGCSRLGLQNQWFFLCKNMITMFQKVDWTQQLLRLLRSMVGLCDFQHCGTGTERAALPS